MIAEVLECAADEILFAVAPFVDLKALKASDPEAYRRLMEWLGLVMSTAVDEVASEAA